MKKYVICGFLFDEEDAKDLMFQLRNKVAGLELIELEDGDRIARWSDVKEAVRAVTKEVMEGMKK